MRPPRFISAAATTLWRNFEVVLLAVAATLAVVPFGRLYADHHYLVLAGGAAVVAAVVSLIVSPRLPLPAAIGAALVAAYLYLAITVFHSLRPAAVWDGVTQSWSTLLTASLPTLSTSTYVALPVAVDRSRHLGRGRAGAALAVEGWSGPDAYRRPRRGPALHRSAATSLAAPHHGDPVAPVAGRAGPGAKAWLVAVRAATTGEVATP